MATKELGFKKPLSKEEKIMKKKERLAAIGKSSNSNIGSYILWLCLQNLETSYLMEH